MRKDMLRAAARVVLQSRFLGVKLGRSKGVIPGARLEYHHGGAKTAAVRTTDENRELSLVRDGEGRWRTIGAVDLFLVAAPKRGDARKIEVFAFDPQKLQEPFDDWVRRTEKRDQRAIRFRTPVLLPLDDKKGLGGKKPGILSKCKCEWREVVDKADVHKTNSRFVQARELLKAGFAEGLGVDPDRVEIYIQFQLKETPLLARKSVAESA